MRDEVFLYKYSLYRASSSDSSEEKDRLVRQKTTDLNSEEMEEDVELNFGLLSLGTPPKRESQTHEESKSITIEYLKMK